jgi:predicted Zn-dependent peptidase
MQATLKNGLRVAFECQEHRRTVNLGLFIEHGAGFETIEDNGISHFIEHVVFHGPNMAPAARELLEDLVAAGMKYEAYTSKDYTRFVLTCLPEQVTAALRLMGLVAAARDVSERAIAHERPIILHEHAMSFTSSRIVMTEMLDYALWGNAGLGLFVIGRRENIERLGKAQLDDVLRRRYVPGCAHLVALGRFAPDAVLADAERWFEPWQATTLTAAERKVVTEPEMVALPSAHQRADLLLGYAGVPFTSPDRLAMELLADVLGAGLKSRLFVELVERRKLAYLARAYPVTYKRGGYLGVHVNCDRKDAREVSAAIAEQLRNVCSDGVTATELARAKAARAMEVLNAAESSIKHLHLLGLRAVMGEAFTADREIARLHEVRLEDVTRLARHMLTPDNAGVVGFGLSRAELRDIA